MKGFPKNEKANKLITFNSYRGIEDSQRLNNLLSVCMCAYLQKGFTLLSLPALFLPDLADPLNIFQLKGIRSFSSGALKISNLNLNS